MVPGVVGRPSTAAAPAGRLRIAHCTGQHRRPQLVDAVTPTPNRTYERGRTRAPTWRPPAERRWSVTSRQFSVQSHPLRAEAFRVMSLAARRAHQELFRYTRDRFRYTPSRRGGVSCRGRSAAVPSQSRGVSANAVYLIRQFRCPATVSLRIAGDWRADHARDVVDTEPQMTKAVLIARGGFIPDEDRILRPADRPGRPPFLRPVGANQSRDDGDGRHRHLARLHDVAVLKTCHMTSIEQVCQR